MDNADKVQKNTREAIIFFLNFLFTLSAEFYPLREWEIVAPVDRRWFAFACTASTLPDPASLPPPMFFPSTLFLRALRNRVRAPFPAKKG
jgi:hypothetical protein